MELMWLLRKIVPDFRCIADFRKDNAEPIREVFKAFVKLCNKAGLFSHESVVIVGSKFRAVNADNKSYVSSNAKKVLLDVEEIISRYMKELDETDAAKSRPGALTKEVIAGVLDYLEHRKAQLTEALEQIAGSGENHICTTDPESRLMKTRDGIRPSFNGDTPTTHPNKGEKSRMFRFQKTDTEVTGEVVSYTEIDLYDRSVVASITDCHITSELAIRTLQKALESQHPPKDGLILHSDQGRQYTSKAFIEFCESAHVIQSMSKAGYPYDNAPMERYFNTL